ncbi:MAG: N-acetylmuramoyl-L-alanine amidase [Cyanobacteria bacterium P01_C01_bin.89]
MGRIFLSAGHGGVEQGVVDLGVQVGELTEAEQMILLRDQVAQTLESRGIAVLSVPDELSLQQTIAWINARARTGDFAVEIHGDSSDNPSVRGMTAYYIANNRDRQLHAELLLRSVFARVPQLANRGARSDTETGLGSRVFCRDPKIPSLLLEVGFLTNAADAWVIQNRRTEIAAGIADGMGRILGVLPDTAAPTYEQIGIRVNNQTYPERGYLINGNSYIPINLAERLRSQIGGDLSIIRVRYRNVVYIKAVDLREFNIAVGWDNPNRTVVLRTVLDICEGMIGRIMGHGSTSDFQLMAFLTRENPSAREQFPDLPNLYREEASAEGVSYDVAFAQMCTETRFLQFGGGLQSSQNNFGGLGDISGFADGASFISARLGVRAHIQHLKAYASTEPLAKEVVDPRFSFVPRGSAAEVQQLTGRWSDDPNYGDKVISRLRQLYELAQFL